MKSNTEFYFFWMQEPDGSKDNDSIQKINDVFSTGKIPPPSNENAGTYTALFSL